MKKLLIGSVQLNTTKNGGKPVADLYSTNTRLEFAELRLFDLSMLADVGINPNTLGEDRLYRRFWAHYELSDKLNKEGNAYRDVVALEPYTNGHDQPGLGDVLSELRQIRRLLETLVQRDAGHLGDARTNPETGELEGDEPPTRTYADGESAETNDAERDAYDLHVRETGEIPASRDALRAWVKARARGPHGTPSHEKANDIRDLLQAIAGQPGQDTPHLTGLCPNCHTSPCACDLVQAAAAGDTPPRTNEDNDGLLRYGDGTLVNDDPIETETYIRYVQVAKEIPHDRDTLRQFYADETTA